MSKKDILRKIIDGNKIKKPNVFTGDINSTTIYVISGINNNNENIIFVYLEYNDKIKTLGIIDEFIGIKLDDDNKMIVCGKEKNVTINLTNHTITNGLINDIEIENYDDIDYKYTSPNNFIYEFKNKNLKYELKNLNSNMIKDLIMNKYLINYPICFISKYKFNFPTEKTKVFDFITDNEDLLGNKIIEYYNSDLDKTKNENIDINQITIEMNKRLINQSDAVKELADAFAIYLSGLKDDNKPILSVLFAGPTGVGKTESCRILNKILFDDTKDSYIRIDCSEYSSPHEVSKLIGAPPGYVGHENGTSLVDQINDNPNSIIIFDEIEKADSVLFDYLLQMMEEGTLTSGAGDKCDMSNCYIIMTSNLGVGRLKELDNSIGFGSAPISNNSNIRKKEIVRAISKKFKPEFINRLDKIIVFNDLSKSDLIQILNLHIDKLNEQMSKRNIKVNFSDGVKSYIVDYDYNRNYGARPIKRNLKHLVYDKLAKKILNDKCKNKTIIIDYINNEIVINFKSKNNTKLKNKQVGG